MEERRENQARWVEYARKHDSIMQIDMMALCKEHVKNNLDMSWTNKATMKTIHLTVMQFQKKKKLVPYLLQQLSVRAVHSGDSRAVDSKATYKLSVLLTGLWYGATKLDRRAQLSSWLRLLEGYESSWNY